MRGFIIVALLAATLLPFHSDAASSAEDAALAAAALLPRHSNAARSVEDFDLRTAEDLIDLCAVPEGEPMVEVARSFCYGYLSGVATYHRAINAGRRVKPLFCLPPKKKPSRAETAELYVAWGRANPQHMKETPIDSVIRFAMATWPCKKPRR
jgi:hypothetical protein